MVIAATIIGIVLTGYVKAPPDMAYIISGFRKEPRILIGRAGIKIPILERKDTLLLKQISIDIKSGGYIPTKDFIGVDVDAVAKICIMSDPEKIKLAMKNFLNMNEKQIIEALSDSLQGNMREIIGTINLKEICNDRKQFGDQIQQKAKVDMNELGIDIISCNIQRVTDKEELIPALGQDNMAQIKKNASIAKAEADRDVAIAKAEADQASNNARVRAETEIARKNNELAIEKAQLRIESDKKKAIADSVYEIEKQEQMKAVNTATVDAQIAKTERETALREQEVAIQEKMLDAQIKKKADAERYETEQKAAADLEKRKRIAEAERYEEEQRSMALRAQADADKYAREQKAAGIKAEGQAEAEAIRAKGLAEAEAMQKKAEAYQKYNNAAMAEMLINVLPDIAGKVAEPLKQIDKITIIGGGEDGNGVGNVANYVPTTMAKVFESVKETIGIDLGEIVKANTYDAKVTKNINISGLPENNQKQEVVFDDCPEETEFYEI